MQVPSFHPSHLDEIDCTRALYIRKAGMNGMASEHKKARSWEIDDIVGMGGIQLYMGCFGLLTTAGVFLIVEGLLEMKTAVDSGLGMMMVGTVFVITGSIMLRRSYAKYRCLNRPDSKKEGKE